MGEGVGSSIVSLLCSRLGLLEAGSCKGLVAFRLDLRRGNEVGEGVGSSIVSLLCLRLGLFEAGPCKGLAAFRLDRSKAPNE